jgi:hypothetical protein
MVVDFQDEGDGWTLQQNSEITVTTADGEIQNIKWNYVTWEAKSGQDFRFNIHRFVDDVLEDDLRGQAQIHPSSGTLTFTFQKPYYIRKKHVSKPGSILFPTGHLLKILEAARKGGKMVSYAVFDGSNLEGPSNIDVFIGNSHTPEGGDPQNLDTQARRFWPVRFAIYGPQNTDEKPDLESTQHIMRSGVSETYVIDYGPYTVKGTLDHYTLNAEAASTP